MRGGPQQRGIHKPQQGLPHEGQLCSSTGSTHASTAPTHLPLGADVVGQAALHLDPAGPNGSHSAGDSIRHVGCGLDPWQQVHAVTNLPTPLSSTPLHTWKRNGCGRCWERHLQSKAGVGMGSDVTWQLQPARSAAAAERIVGPALTVVLPTVHQRVVAVQVVVEAARHCQRRHLLPCA